MPRTFEEIKAELDRIAEEVNEYSKMNNESIALYAVFATTGRDYDTNVSGQEAAEVKSVLIGDNMLMGHVAQHDKAFQKIKDTEEMIEFVQAITNQTGGDE